LHDIALQAKEIGRRKFGYTIVIPKTTQLKDVVGATNSMFGQLEQVFCLLDQEVSELKNDKLVD
jgi:nitrate/nitrite-specific signal transduction histidine kinase